MKTHTRFFLILTLLLGCALPSVAWADSDHSDALTISSSNFTLQPQPLSAPLLATVGGQMRAPQDVTLDLQGRLRLFAQTARESVMTYFKVGQIHRVTTAQVPLFLGDECLLVSGEYISYNLLPTQGQERDEMVVFGPYIQNWKSARKDYDGHYGLRLMLPW
jgi:hypothetical protein